MNTNIEAGCRAIIETRRPNSHATDFFIGRVTDVNDTWITADIPNAKGKRFKVRAAVKGRPMVRHRLERNLKVAGPFDLAKAERIAKETFGDATNGATNGANKASKVAKKAATKKAPTRKPRPVATAAKTEKPRSEQLLEAILKELKAVHATIASGIEKGAEQ